MMKPLNIEHAFEWMCFIGIYYCARTHTHKRVNTLPILLSIWKENNRKKDSLTIYCSDDNNKFQKNGIP